MWTIQTAGVAGWARGEVHTRSDHAAYRLACLRSHNELLVFSTLHRTLKLSLPSPVHVCENEIFP